MKAIARVVFAVALALLASAAPAQEYPAKPIRVIVPVPPGGANDTKGHKEIHKIRRVR